MVASFNLDFDIAAAALLIVEMIYVRLQYSHDKYSNRLFIMLLHSSLLLAIVDMVSSLMLTVYVFDVSHVALKIVCSLYYLVSAFVVLVFYRYVVEYLGAKPERTVSYYVITYFPFCFILECLFANCFANILFVGGKYGNFTYGPLITIIYIYPVYYFFITIIRLIRSRKQITLRQGLSVFAYIIITLLTMASQFFFQDVMIMPFGFAISILIMMFSLETPDYKKLMKTTEMLETVRDEMEYLNAFGQAFITEMTDEICIPVGKLIEKNDTYNTDELEDSQKELHEYVNGYANIVRSVINNIVELNTMSVGMTDTVAKEYRIRDAVSDVCDMMSPAAKDTANSLTVDISSNVPDVLVGYGLLVKQIMINLIGNAVMNTREGTISVEVSGRRIEQDSMNLVISVADTGKGMSRNAVRKLLQFNTRGKKWNKEYFDDGNFKVRISKRIVENMHGKLYIDSTAGRGSKFTAVIPQGIVDNVTDR